MANNEATFRLELLHAFRDARIRAKGNSPENDVGRPDIYVKALDKPSVWIELKYTARLGKIKITPMQLRWLREEREAGGFAAWVTCYRASQSEWRLYAGLTGDTIAGLTPVAIRKRGQEWPVKQLLDHIIELHKVGF